jgi:hypothetical protein
VRIQRSTALEAHCRRPRRPGPLRALGLLLLLCRQYLEVPPSEQLDLTNELAIPLWIQSDNFDTPLVNKLEYWAPGN